MKIDHGRAEPLFRQVADQIAARIESATYPAGYRLPPTRALAAQIGTHRNTVVRAYEVLVDGGWVESVVGRGTFVADVTTRPPPKPSPTALTPLRWESLLTNAASSEVLTRADRLPGARVRGSQLIDLAAMQPSRDMLPSRELRLCIDHVLRTLGPKALGYAPRQGLPALREQIALDLASRGVPADAGDIVVTTGSQQALDLIARALIEPGDAFAVDAETYTGAINLLTIAGAKLVPIPVDSAGPSIDALEQFAVTPRAKGVYLMPNCRNPTGEAISADRRHQLVEWSHRTGLPLIEDDYGADLDLTGELAPPALRTLDPDILHVSTFSKRLIPALRVGFLVCPPALRPALVALKHTIDLGTSVLLQHALAEFLERGYLRAHLRRILPIYRQRRDALEEALEEHLPDDVSHRRLERGLVLWLELPSDVRSEDVFLEAQRAGVLVGPGSLHTVSGREQHGIRITIAREDPDRIGEGISRLAKAIQNARRRGDKPPQLAGI